MQQHMPPSDRIRAVLPLAQSKSSAIASMIASASSR